MTTTTETGRHTPGPWEMWRCTNNETWGISAQGHARAFRIAYTAPTLHNDEARAENEANARLIAAAPDLLWALRDLLKAQVCDECFICDQARAAIAKATGEDTKSE